MVCLTNLRSNLQAYELLPACRPASLARTYQGVWWNMVYSVRYRCCHASGAWASNWAWADTWSCQVESRKQWSEKCFADCWNSISGKLAGTIFAWVITASMSSVTCCCLRPSSILLPFLTMDFDWWIRNSLSQTACVSALDPVQLPQCAFGIPNIQYAHAC